MKHEIVYWPSDHLWRFRLPNGSWRTTRDKDLIEMFFWDDETTQLEFTLEDNIENRSRQSPPASGTDRFAGRPLAANGATDSIDPLALWHEPCD